MARRPGFMLASGVLMFAAMAASPAAAAGVVRVELVGDAQGAALAFQEWGQTLGRAGIRNVRLRAARDSDTVGIDVQGTGENTVYVVTGIVRSRDELLLPGGRYRRADVGRLAQWLNDLAERGPAKENEETGPTAFGLSTAQLDRLQKRLAAPVGFSTQGEARQAVVRKMTDQLGRLIQGQGAAAQDPDDEKVAEDLAALSSGTSLAYVLRSMGYGLKPRPDGEEAACEIVALRPGLETWSIGRETDKPDRELLPNLYEFLNVNVQNVSAATALKAIGKRLGAPVLLDHRALAKHRVEPDKVMVSLPRSRTTYSLALRKLLFQARLRFEVRCDEAGTPFLWVTTIKPVE